MDKKVTGIVAYLTFIGWIIAYCAGDREGAKFHLNQALVLTLANVIASAMGELPIPFSGVIGWMLNAVIGVFAIIGFIYACMGEEKALPIVSQIQILK